MKKLDLLEGQEYIVKSIDECYDKDFVGEENWLIISALTEDEIVKRFAAEIDNYKPYVFLSLEQYEVIIDYKRNVMKYKKREQNIISFSNLDVDDEDKDYRLPVYLDKYFDDKGWAFFQKIYGVSKLSEKQQKRLFLIAYVGLTYEEVAEGEGIPISAIHESVDRAKKKLVRLHKNLQNSPNVTTGDAGEDVQ